MSDQIAELKEIGEEFKLGLSLSEEMTPAVNP